MAMTCHWLGNLIEWISDSWNVFDGEGLDYEISFDKESDEETSYEALEREQTVRSILKTCVSEEMSAEFIRVNMIGYCRALGAIAHMAASESTDKQICMESAGVIAVTATTEKMLSSVGNFKLISKYQFINTNSDEE
jgi:hypothetical protein